MLSKTLTTGSTDLAVSDDKEMNMLVAVIAMDVLNFVPSL